MPTSAKIDRIIGSRDDVKHFGMALGAMHEWVLVQFSKPAPEGHLLLRIQFLVTEEQHMMGYECGPNRTDELIR